MAQWGQGQPGYQYPLQTGFPGQNSGFQQPQGFPQQGGLVPQPTGYQGLQRPGGYQQPQQTGFPGGGPGLLPQQTGIPNNFNGGFVQPQQQQRPPIPPVPPLPNQFQQQQQQQQQQQPQQTGYLGLQGGQQNRFLNPSPGPGAGLAPQPTGFPGQGPLIPQATGFIDPRLQMMSSTFLPANTSAPYNAAGVPQLQQQPQFGGLSLQQSFQQHNQEVKGTAAPRVPWALSKGEKKSYDQIFRAWDAAGTGFIDGGTAIEVFGQSGLDRNDLARIWTLADVDNRGKLNIAEFHVAMGLIYRKLNGNEIPDQLPPELVPPSHRDLGESVDFLKGLLKNDVRARSPSAVDAPISRLKERSFNSPGATGAGGRQDATVYKHTDTEPAGGYYTPRSRHLDRDTVRGNNDRDNPSSDLKDLRRQLETTANRLDSVADENASRTAEDEALDREMSDLRWRVKRVQEDLDYVSTGPRSSSSDEERRRLERELLKLLHERVPEVERKLEERKERKEREKRERDRERDRRNDRFGRYDDHDSDRGGYRSYSRNEDRDRYGSYDRDRDRDRDRDSGRDRDRDRDYDRPRDYDRDRSYRDRSPDRSRDYNRPRSPPAVRSPPPPPPPAPSSSLAKPPPPPPTASPAPQTKNMTPAERQAFIKAEAQRRLAERMAALGVAPPPSAASSPTVDTSVGDRLAQERREAEEKAQAAEKAAEERERARRERLEGEKAIKDGRSPSTPAPPAPPAPKAAPVAPKAAPPPPKARAPAPPPPRGVLKQPPPVAARSQPPAPPAPRAAPPAPAPPPPAPVVDPEEERLREREEALRKQREERLERLRRLEQEEEEDRKREDDFKKRRDEDARRREEERKMEEEKRRQAEEERLRAQSVPPPAPPPPAVAPTPPPPPPSAPPAASEKGSHNPFNRLMGGGAPATPPAPVANGGNNPFFKTQATPTPPPPPPPPPPPVVTSQSPAPRGSYNTAPSGDSEDDWGQEKDDDDSSDDELDSSRDTRNKLAQQLFGSILPPARPQSAAGASNTTPKASTFSTPTPPPPPPSAPPMMFDGGAPPAPAPPPPPPAPGPPPPPTAIAAPASSGGRSALLSAIQGGARLRKAVTNDRSSAPVSGKVIGDVAPPAHINTSVRSPSPPVATPVAPPLANDDSKNSNRQSVDWYAGLAADHGAVSREPSGLASTREEDEDEDTRHAGPVPSIQVEESDPLEDVDKATEYRVRSLYAYEGQRAEDLSFGENLILTAHPSKSGGDWWHGTIVRDGKSGFFPKTYVQIMDIVKAKALYAYTGASADELPFAEGDVLSIVDRSESDWWKAEQGGVVFIVPAAYLELVEDGAPPPSSSTSTPAAQEVLPDTPRPPSHQTGMEGGSMNIDSSAGSSALTLLSSSDQRSLSSIDNDSDMDASDTDYHSFSDSDTDEDTDHEQQQTEEERKLEREARAMERKMVMEAAGLIIKQDERRPPPRPVRRNRSLRAAATKPRRPPPVVPAPRRQTSTASLTADPNKSLPAVPDHDVADGESILRLDDAFDRYEAFKLQGSDSASNRLSMASFDSGNGPVPPSPASRPRPRRLLHLASHLTGKVPTQKGDGERRVFPVISGPISGPIGGAGAGEESRTPVGRESDPSFGLSWSSIVDKSALEGLPERERKRQEAIFEFIATEAAYVRDLQLIVEVFYGNLLDKLEPKAITVIFANVEDILLTNTTFLSSLEERQRDCRLYIDRIGDLLDSNLQNMKIYR
ncbi:hypothetical protein OF83DRAFT_1174805, partial [Amylostereum chailletii]